MENIAIIEAKYKFSNLKYNKTKSIEVLFIEIGNLREKFVVE